MEEHQVSMTTDRKKNTRFENESLKWRMVLGFYSTHESTIETLTPECLVIFLIIALEKIF